MADPTLPVKVDRRSFLRGSALFAGALGLGVASLAAEPQSPPQKKEPKAPPPEDDPFRVDGKPKRPKKRLIDSQGREYRVCPQCAYNMYKQGRMWVCENCGYSYVE